MLGLRGAYAKGGAWRHPRPAMIQFRLKSRPDGRGAHTGLPVAGVEESPGTTGQGAW